MKHQIKQILIASACLLLSVSAKANTNCQWSSVGSLTHEVQSAQDLLTQYGPCRSDCQSLEAKLDSRLSVMNKASACAPHILTRGNRELISFIGSRYRLIKKQKSAQSWYQAAGAPNTAVAKPVAVAPVAARAPAPTPVVITQKPASAEKPQTTMVISQEAYAALWLDDETPKKQAPAEKQVSSQAAQAAALQQQAARQRASHQATQAQRQQIQLRKQALLQQQRLREAYIKQRQLRAQQNEQRALQLRREQTLARERYWQQQKLRQQELARARGN